MLLWRFRLCPVPDMPPHSTRRRP